MKKTLLILTIGSFLQLFFGIQLLACPACNIHNYLASSIQSSKNIFLGEVLGKVDDATAEVKVLKVLRGGNVVGEKVKTEMYGSQRYVGQKFIFSDPISHPPRFEAVPVELEDEILFLIQENPSVNNLEDAVKRVQGISRETKQIGTKYISEYHAEAIKPLIEELNSILPQVLEGKKELIYGEYRAENMINALLIKPSEEGRAFLLSYIDGIAKQKQLEINWESPPRFPSSCGMILFEILATARDRGYKELSADLKKHLEEILPKLSGSVIADCVSAAVRSGAIPTDELKSILDGNKDMLALGLFHAGNEASSNWAHKTAYEYWDQALLIAERLELKKEISERIKGAEKIFKRETKTGNGETQK